LRPSELVVAVVVEHHSQLPLSQRVVAVAVVVAM
jgi:hypothetical protein